MSARHSWPRSQWQTAVGEGEVPVFLNSRPCVRTHPSHTQQRDKPSPNSVQQRPKTILMQITKQVSPSPSHSPSKKELQYLTKMA